MKEDNYAVTKYFRNIGLAGLALLAYVGARHLFGAEQMPKNFQPKSLKDLLVIADYAIGGLGLLAYMGSVVWTPLVYLMERCNKNERK